MKLKKFYIPVLIFLLAVIVAGIIIIPKITRALAFQEAMKMNNIEHTFIYMNETITKKQ